MSSINVNSDSGDINVVDTSSGTGAEQHKYPMCGAPGILLNRDTGML